ncbi:hypothetical protein GCM10008018_69710 [Paenibacillus marchantiophytorum]|uniref:Uncharacterized protein n=1 Tax=Paenibacillus marchantiophytorum TaxID=1619310 RepID=A0ABQ1FJ21_9BACL|nr:hypothetical protein [Paenibacillus marchantiophytorum]GGA14895.1 hypothetical protein GCM10008018_69710 [Paenibacillus marchantiophytorum]
MNNRGLTILKIGTFEGKSYNGQIFISEGSEKYEACIIGPYTGTTSEPPSSETFDSYEEAEAFLLAEWKKEFRE